MREHYHSRLDLCYVLLCSILDLEIGAGVSTLSRHLDPYKPRFFILEREGERDTGSHCWNGGRGALTTECIHAARTGETAPVAVVSRGLETAAVGSSVGRNDE